MNYNALPLEMIALWNWVCWKAVPDPSSHSGIKKIPINPKTGGQAMSNNPDTWSDFDTAVRESARYDGIGFMFSNSPFFGIDLDDCSDDINAYLKGMTDNIAAEFINTMQTYAELSQSGNGIHLICRGTLPTNGRRKGKVEMYDSGRFFIMTGKNIGGYSAIAEGTESVKPLHAKYLGTSKPAPAAMPVSVRTAPNMTEQVLIEKMLNSANGDKFAKLYSGDFSDYPSQSEADMAFCSILAFWCGGDTVLMDSIYRSSGLMRDKWDRKQNGSTYGKITLAKAVSQCSNFYNPQPQDDDDFYIEIGSGDTKPAPNKRLPMHTLDDTGNAERMNDYCGDVFRYNYTDKRWIMVSQSLWDKMTGTETIVVSSSSGKIAFRYVHNASEFVSKAVHQIENYKGTVNSRSTTATPAPANVSITDQLNELNALRENGLISDADYEAKKKQILGL